MRLAVHYRASVFAEPRQGAHGSGPLVSGPASRGFSVTELVVVLAIFALAILLAWPPLIDLSARLRVDLAASETASKLRLARATAIRKGAYVAVRFEEGESGPVQYAMYIDTDLDGVLNRDIESGVDRQLAPPRPLSLTGRHIRLGFPEGKPPLKLVRGFDSGSRPRAPRGRHPLQSVEPCLVWSHGNCHPRHGLFDRWKALCGRGSCEVSHREGDDSGV